MPDIAETDRRVRRWIELDPDPATRSELGELLSRAEAGEDEARAQLEKLFAGRLAFGTAGLRAELGPGPLRMNRLVVRQTAAGLLRYAEQKLQHAQATADNPQDLGGQGARRTVIGYDARHQSYEFAADTAQVFADAGWEVHIFDRPGPTPLLARQMPVRDAEVGVMVTASHNPPRDNGYKVYLGGELSRFLEPDGRGSGAQIIPPVDAEIAETIAEAVAEDVAAASSGTPSSAGAALSSSTLSSASAEAGSLPASLPAGVVLIDDQGRQSYQDEALELLDRARFPHRDLTIVYTAMHGVGGEMVAGLLKAGGFDNVITVDEQFTPDPDFPTADFPNPEEDGALDLGLAAARKNDADLLLANDPDADRLSAAVVDPHTDRWRQLTGDEIGVLLGRHILDRGPLRPQAGTTSTPDSLERAEQRPVLANSVVSSRLLERLAHARGAGHAATLTGFKWLARVEDMVFGYEEAIGFNVDPAYVKDKDGVSAALIFAELVADLKARGSSPIQALDEIAAEAGVFATGQVTVRVNDLSELGQVTARLRDAPPTQIAGASVVEALDLMRDPLPGTGTLNEATKTDALIYLTDKGDRVIVRPSGTEPKVKCYLEAVEETAEQNNNAGQEAIRVARERATERLKALHQSMSQMLS